MTLNIRIIIIDDLESTRKMGLGLNKILFWNLLEGQRKSYNLPIKAIDVPAGNQNRAYCNSKTFSIEAN
jgi:hypothetical protein